MSQTNNGKSNSFQTIAELLNDNLNGLVKFLIFE